jgi:surface protein
MRDLLFKLLDEIEPNEILNVSNWDTANVINMGNMFYNCELSTLDLSGWNTANVTTMSGMFHYCSKFNTLKLGINFIMTQVTNTTDMFTNCKLKTDRTGLDFNGTPADTQTKINAALAA